jgi:hypothetical protein
VLNSVVQLVGIIVDNVFGRMDRLQHVPVNYCILKSRKRNQKLGREGIKNSNSDL